MSLSPAHTRQGRYAFGPFQIDPEKETLFRDGERIDLTPKAFQLLLVLVRHSNETVTKDRLMNSVWPDTFVEETNLTRNIFSLRKALGETEQDRYIITVPGQGYRLAHSARLEVADEISIVAGTQSRVRAQVAETKPLWQFIAAALLLFAACAGTLRFLMHRKPVLTEKSRIVLAEFSNSTGDSVFDGTLRQGMAIQLEQSPFLSLVSGGRIQRTLAQMGLPVDVLLTGETAREVCQRAGATVVIDGSIAPLGSGYVLGLQAKNCGSGEVLDEEQQQLSTKEDVLSALSQMASRLRTRVGESLATVEKYSTPLAEATTQSLEALRAYSAGWQVHSVHGASAALPFFQRATEIDPQFAMAHASLGRMYGDVDQLGLAAASTTRAWELRDRTSEHEKFFITSNYEIFVTGNLEAAQPICEVWARTYPREALPHLTLAGIVHKAPGRYEAALDESRKAVDLEPDFWVGYYGLAVNNVYLGRLNDAESVLRTATARGLDADEFIMLAYDIAFLKDDWTGMEREAARAKAQPGGENWMSAREAQVSIYSGRLLEARKFSQRAVVQAQQAGQPERASLWAVGAGIHEALFGNKKAARDWARLALKLSNNREVEYGAALALAMANDFSGTRAIEDDMGKRFPADSSVQFNYLPTVRAALALSRREPGQAEEALQIAVPHELGIPRSGISGLFGALYPVYFRGQAYLAANRGSAAAAEFQKILDHRGIVVSDPIAALAHLQLGRAYVRMGDKEKAKSAYQDFLALWKNADAELPILQQAKQEYAKLK